MKIYTKTGDKGETSLIGGTRVSKSCIEMKAIGEVDELNTAISYIAAELIRVGYRKTAQKFSLVQHKLFTLGSSLAAVQTDLANIPSLVETDIENLEKWIDVIQADLEPLEQFILPAGHLIAVHSFSARAICRRAEREVVSLCNKYEDLDVLPQKYLNRLSDFLFVFGRFANKKFGVEEITWKK